MKDIKIKKRGTLSLPTRRGNEANRRVAVISPHLDDAVLSIGGTIATYVDAGADVSLITICGGVPESTKAAGEWDRRAGFATEGQAAIARRAEDLLACERLGARPVWLPFTDEQYGGIPKGPLLYTAVESALGEADFVLIPGFPLSHPDHRDVAEAIVTRLGGERAVGLYVEQPYALAGGRPKVPPFLPSQPAMKMGWTRSRIPRALREVKWRSCQAYASQLPLLQSEWPLMRMRMELYELRHGEPVAWLP